MYYNIQITQAKRILASNVLTVNWLLLGSFPVVWLSQLAGKAQKAMMNGDSHANCLRVFPSSAQAKLLMFVY